MGALSAMVVLLLAVSGVPAGAQSTDVPSSPEGLSVTSVTHDSVTLSWTALDDSSVTGYQVLRRDHADGPDSTYAVIADDLGSDTTTYVDTDVSASSSYSYRVKARNAAGLSASSGNVRADTPAVPAPVTYRSVPVAQIFSKSVPGPNSPQSQSPQPQSEAPPPKPEPQPQTEAPPNQGVTTKDDGQANDDKKETDKEPVDELAGQRSSHDSTQDSTAPSQPTSSASPADEDPPDDKDPDTDPQTAPRPTQQEMMDRFSVRVAPPSGSE